MNVYHITVETSSTLRLRKKCDNFINCRPLLKIMFHKVVQQGFYVMARNIIYFIYNLLQVLTVKEFSKLVTS